MAETLRLLADGLQPADRLPPDGLAELRALRWVMGDEVVELAGIGWYHAGSKKDGLLGWRSFVQTLLAGGRVPPVGKRP